MDTDQNQQGLDNNNEINIDKDDQKKRGPSDGSEIDVSEDEQEEKSGMTEDEFEEELEKLKKKREEQEAERKKELERMRDDARKKREEKTKQREEQKVIARQPVAAKKIFERKKNEGIFRHHRLTDFSASKKLEKALKKIHGVPLKKKLEFISALKAYSPVKSVLLKKDLEDFARGVKYKRFTSAKFNRMKKVMDPQNLKFKRREVDKIKRALTGKEDPHKYQRRDMDLNKPARGRK